MCWNSRILSGLISWKKRWNISIPPGLWTCYLLVSCPISFLLSLLSAPESSICWKYVCQSRGTYTLPFKSLASKRVVVLFQEIHTFFGEGRAELIKSDSKDIYNVTKYNLCQMNVVLLNFLFSKGKKTVSTAILNSTTFSTLIIIIFIERKIGILEWFLKDHVTLKSGVMIADNSALPSQE